MKNAKLTFVYFLEVLKVNFGLSVVFSCLYKNWPFKKNFLISNWSFSELAQKLKRSSDCLLLTSDKFSILFKNIFESIYIFRYLSRLKKKVNYSHIIIEIIEMNNFKKNNHFYYLR